MQQCAIAAAHQSQAGLHQADGPAAQLMRFPGAFRDAFSAEQHFGNDAISSAIQVPVERA